MAQQAGNGTNNTGTGTNGTAQNGGGGGNRVEKVVFKVAPAPGPAKVQDTVRNASPLEEQSPNAGKDAGSAGRIDEVNEQTVILDREELLHQKPGDGSNQAAAPEPGSKEEMKRRVEAIRKNITEWGNYFMLNQQSFSRFITAGYKTTSSFTNDSQHSNFGFILRALDNSAKALDPQAFDIPKSKGIALGSFIAVIENPKFQPYMLYTFRKILETYQMDLQSIVGTFNSFNKYITKWESSIITQRMVEVEKAAWTVGQIANDLGQHGITMRCNDPMVAFLENMALQHKIGKIMDDLDELRNKISQ